MASLSGLAKRLLTCCMRCAVLLDLLTGCILKPVRTVWCPIRSLPALRRLQFPSTILLACMQQSIQCDTFATSHTHNSVCTFKCPCTHCKLRPYDCGLANQAIVAGPTVACRTQSVSANGDVLPRSAYWIIALVLHYCTQ